MATALNQNEAGSNKLYHKYSTSWSLENLKSLGVKSIKTNAISPIPNSDAEFYFEIWYQERSDGSSNYEKTSYFKMVLWKKAGVNIPQSMKMNITVFINDANDVILKKYQKVSISVNEVEVITISSEIFKFFIYDPTSKRYEDTGNPCFGSYSKLLIRCHLVFSEDLITPSDYFRNMRFLKNLKEFVNDFDRIYQPSLLTDIEFKIGNESLSAHKCILAAHSPVFQRMICNDFLESKTNTISISDSSPEIFKCFLKYFYSGEIGVKTWEVVKELFILADKYDVRILKKECSEITASILSVDIACDVLKMAYGYGDEYLKREANVFAVKNILEIAPKDEWKELIDSSPIIGYNVMKNFAPKFPSIPPVE